MTLNLKTLLFAAMASVLLALTATGAGRDTDRKKARHYFYEGVRFEAQDRADMSLEMFRKAWEADPTYAEAANAYGIKRLMLNLDTLQSPAETRRSLALARRIVDEYPDDIYEAEYYAYLTQMLDTVDETIRVLHIMDSVAPDRTRSLLGLARAYASKGRFGEAIKALDTYEQREGPTQEVTLARMSWRLYANDTIGAINDATVVMNRNPGDITYIILRGNVFEAVNMPDSALRMFSMAERIDSASALPKLALASLYRDMGDSVRYDEKTYEALLSDNLEMEEKVQLLAEYLQAIISNRQDTVRGDHLFSVLSIQYPHEAQVLDLAARYNAAKGNYAAAIDKIRYAIDQDRNNESYWGQLMTYQIQNNEPAMAMRSYHEASPHLPDSPGLDMLFATAAQMNHDYDTVINVYSRMIRDIAPDVNPLDSLDMKAVRLLSYENFVALSNFFTSLGDAQFSKKDVAAAFLSYDNALSLMDDNALTLNNYAYFLTQEGGDLQKAAEMSLKSLRFMPDNPTFLDTYAWILYLQGDYVHALEYQEAAIEKSKENGEQSPELMIHYGDILFRNGRTDDAVQAWQKALDSDKGDLSEAEIKLLRKKISHKTLLEK